MYSDELADVAKTKVVPLTNFGGDDQLIREFIAGTESADPHNAFINIPRSACEAVVRRLRSTF